MNPEQRSRIAFFWAALLIVSLIYSKFLLTISMMGLLLTAWVRRPLATVFPRSGKGFLSLLILAVNPMYVIAAVWVLFFVWCLVTGLWSSDVGYFIERMRIRLPFLIMPLAFIGLPRFSARQFALLHYILIAVLSGSALGVVYQYVLQSDAFLQVLKQGQAMPTPMSHIRYSLLLAYGCVAGVWCSWRGVRVWAATWERPLLMVLTLGLFVFLHFLSVRSGLVAVYIGLATLLIYFLIEQKNWLIGFVALAMLGIMPIAAYRMFPSLQTKIAYMRWDYATTHTLPVEGANSDAGRRVAWQLAWETFQTAPVVGIGVGDVKPTMDRRYAERYPALSPKLPHNQWLTVGMGTGIIGCLLLLLLLGLPCYYAYRQPLVVCLTLLIGSSLLVEDTFENAIGTAIYTFFIWVLLCSRPPLIAR